jgi:hypothetical protein
MNDTPSKKPLFSRIGLCIIFFCLGEIVGLIYGVNVAYDAKFYCEELMSVDSCWAIQWMLF